MKETTFITQTLFEGKEGNSTTVLLGKNDNSFDMQGILKKNQAPTIALYSREKISIDVSNNLLQDEAFMNILNEFKKTLNQLPVDKTYIIIASEDFYALLLSLSKEGLNENIVHLTPSSEVVLACYNKIAFSELCSKLGIAAPLSQVISTISQIHTSSLPTPGIIKPHINGAIPKSIVDKVAIIYDQPQLIDIASKIIATGQIVFYQEFIPGRSSDIFFVSGFFDFKNNNSKLFTGIKLTEFPATGGVACHAKIVDNEAVMEKALIFLNKTEYQGLVDIEYKIDSRTNEIIMIETNPRIGLQHKISTSKSGDVISFYYHSLCNRSEKSNYTLPPSGSKWIRPEKHICSTIEKKGLIVGIIITIIDLIGAKTVSSIDLTDFTRTLQHLKNIIGFTRKLSLKTLIFGNHNNS